MAKGYDAKNNIGTSPVISVKINHAPVAPSSPSPANVATGVSTSPTLSWSCTDPDGNAITYDVFFGITNPPTSQVATGQSTNTLYRTGLSNNTTYYWKVNAKDSKGAATTGSVWSFKTTPGLPLAGSWSGTDISFTVGDSPLSVSNLEFTYSGHFSGTYCSANYVATVTFSSSTKLNITNNSFSYTSSSYTINGSFSDNINATIKISWNIYDSYCNAYYSGSKTYSASYNGSAKTTINKISSKPNDNEEIIEFTEEGLKTFIKKNYEDKN